MRKRWAWILACWAIVALCPMGVSADPARDRARALNRRGMIKFDAADYVEALSLFENAYATYPDPRVLFNIGQTYRRRGDWAHALESYRSYLADQANAPNRAEVEASMRELEERLRVPEEPQPAVPTVSEAAPAAPAAPLDLAVPPPAARRSWSDDRMAWALSGTGVALGVAGAVFLARAQSEKADLATTPEGDQGGLRERIARNQTVGAIGLSLGGALLVAGVVKFVVTEQAARKHSLALSIGAGGVHAQGTF